MVTKIVSKNDFEIKLLSVEKHVKTKGNPKYGVFGPDSMTWLIGRESAVFFGSAYALMMQEAHPWVATGAYHHSKVKNDPFGRWKRTFESVNSIMFGDLDTALKYARLTHNIHSKVVGKLPPEHGGTSYHANHEDALMWVAATLGYTAVWMYEMFVDNLSILDKNNYYEEFKLFCYMFGISDETIPENWNAFEDYYINMSYGKDSPLKIGEHGEEMINHFMEKFEGQYNIFNIPSKIFMNATFSLMPERLVKEYGFEYDFKKEILAHISIKTVKNCYKRLPLKIRMNPYFRNTLKKYNLYKNYY